MTTAAHPPDAPVGPAAGDASLVGAKAARLIAARGSGLPVPHFFVLDRALASRLASDDPGVDTLSELDNRLRSGIAELERLTQRRFGDPVAPLLVAVRGSSVQGVPGAIESVVNVGIDDEVCAGLQRATGDARFAVDAFRRYVEAAATAVLGVHPFYLEEELEAAKEARGLRGRSDDELDAEGLADGLRRYRAMLTDRGLTPLSSDPWRTLATIVVGVARSWHATRAVRARARARATDAPSFGIVVQSMVFGNLGADSGSGAAGTHDPTTGAPQPWVRFAPRCQAADLRSAALASQSLDQAALQPALSPAVATLADVLDRLSGSSDSPQRVEFVVERGRLWLLQVSDLQVRGAAIVRVATDRVETAGWSRQRAVDAVDPATLGEITFPTLDPDAATDVLTVGLPASPGAASGRLAFSADEAEARALAGEAVVFVRTETGPDDVRGMRASAAVITSRGGATSHAAVLAVQMGRPCVVGCSHMRVDPAARRVTMGSRSFGPDDVVTVNGTRGEVIAGAIPVRAPAPSPELDRLLGWADELRTIDVRANADRPGEVRLAMELGASGIGLVRTEHMFLDGERLRLMRAVIAAPRAAQRERAVAELTHQQARDILELLAAADGAPLAIRLLDPPLHEFLPTGAAEIDALASDVGSPVSEVRRAVERMRERNPMLGHRGARVGITSPAIYSGQVRAICSAIDEHARQGGRPDVELLFPLVSNARELQALRNASDAVVATELRGGAARPRVGAMIETPHACLAAGEIAALVDFVSFGTNDLTQTTWGLSRDDTATFLPQYLAAGVLEHDPFTTLGDGAVLELMRIASARARAANPLIRVGICGEHAGDPASLRLLRTGVVDSVSCNPWKVPVARLALAQSDGPTDRSDPR